jgi:crossover junction endodeoxyribonuclease RuvC|tara:strand:+ start:1069 stop:1572 length:504 start_codon:yes stop_codon:yes gene_type:complete
VNQLQTTNEKRRILGIDPGVNITGYGVIDQTGRQFELVEAGVLRGGKGDLSERCLRLYQGLVEVLESLKPDEMAIEQLYSHYQRPRTAIIMAHARGVLCLAAQQRKILMRDYAATQIKKVLTGNGRASKGQMQFAICREFQLSEVPEPPDVADALATALCHAFIGRS